MSACASVSESFRQHAADAREKWAADALPAPAVGEHEHAGARHQDGAENKADKAAVADRVASQGCRGQDDQASASAGPAVEQDQGGDEEKDDAHCDLLLPGL